MRRPLASAFVLVAALGSAIIAGNAAAARFRAVDVYVDSGSTPLAAYQVEIVARGATIAGVEGGQRGAFVEPPHYDPAALQAGRIILAAFDTGTDLPSGRTRVATLHLREDGPADYEIRLIAAAGAGGERLDATASVEPRQGE